MTKYYIFLLFILFNFSTYSQSIYVNTGQNKTTYNYKNSQNQELQELRSGLGMFVETGINFKINSKKEINRWSCNLGFILNQFNSYAYINSSEYTWKTKYFGLKNDFIYRLTNKTSNLNLNLNTGFSFMKIISGTQRNNSVFYDLKNNSEFQGLFVEPNIGANISYSINKKTNLYLGYNISKAVRLKKKVGGESLNGFNNQRVYLGLNFKI